MKQTLLGAIVLCLAGCAGQPADSLHLESVPFAAMPGWQAECPISALDAFSLSCTKRPKSSQLANLNAWETACAAIPETATCMSARQFFETHFSAHVMTTATEETGLLTGYYEPALRGSRHVSETYATPVYAMPDDVVMADLGDFDPDLAGRKIRGHIVQGQFKPYPPRADIVGKGLKGAEPLVYVDNPVDAFFLQIQGSGRVALDEGGEMRVGYAGQNGHKYVAIGRTLLAQGALERGKVSLQSIKAWLEAHPGAEADAVMNSNPSFVFFRALEGDAVGAQNIPLTPLRSMAVDRRHIALGLPVFIEAEDPVVSGGHIRRLMIAQDTGGAIKGPLRGDFFWGHGAAAENRAGLMKSTARFWLLLPKEP